MWQARQWVYCLKKKDNCTKRIFCFPYAGASSVIFHKWIDYFPDSVELFAIELPGRGRRFAEPLISEMNLLVEDLAKEMHPYLDKPFQFFGHSMGALISFELACWLKKHYGISPEHLWVSAHTAPHLNFREEPFHKMPEEKFKTKLIELNGFPKEVLENEELFNLVLPIIRSDFQICETYNLKQKIQLDCAITAFGGANDSFVKIPDLIAWKYLTQGEFNFILIEGDHFFITNSYKKLIKNILAQNNISISEELLYA